MKGEHMRSVFQADLFKLRKRAMGWVMLLLGLLLTTLVITLAAFGPEELSSRVSFIFPNALLTGTQTLSQFGGLMLLILGATLIGSEYGYDTWKNMLTRHPRRVTFIVAKWVVMVLALALAAVVLPLWAQALGLVLNLLLGLGSAPASVTLGMVLVLAVVEPLGLLVAGGIGMLGAVLGRSTAAGIIGGIAWLLIDNLLAQLLPETFRVLTFAANNSALMLHLSGAPAPISLATTLTMFGTYLVLPVALAALFFERRDMAGN